MNSGLILLVTSLLWVVSAQFQSGNIQFRRTSATTREIQFVLTLGFDPNYYPGLCSPIKCDCTIVAGICRPVVGSTVIVPADATSAIGETFNFGDGSTITLSKDVCRIGSIDAASTQVICTFSRVYAASVTSATAFYRKANRVVTTNNNGTTAFNIQAIIDPSAIGSPVVGVTPVTHVWQTSTTQTTLTIPLVGSSFDPAASLTFALSSSALTRPTGLSIGSASGVLTWDVSTPPLNNQLFTTVVTVADSQSANQISVEFILQFHAFSASLTPPAWSSVSSAVPAWVGNQVSFSASASWTTPPFVFHGPIPATFQETASVAGSINTTSVTLTPTSSNIGVYVVCFTAQTTAISTALISAPACVVLSVYNPCPRGCTSATNGRCLPQPFSNGICSCNSGYCLEDCRAFYGNQRQASACVPQSLLVSMTPNTRAAVSRADFSVALPATLGNELWFTLPQGWTADPTQTSLTWNFGFTQPLTVVVVGPAFNVIQLRSNTSIVPSGSPVTFSLTNVKIANNCQNATWTLESRTCTNDNLFGVPGMPVRNCPVPSTPTSWTVSVDHRLRCDMCNACELRGTLNGNTQWFACEHNGLTFWRTEVLNGPCWLQGVPSQ